MNNQHSVLNNKEAMNIILSEAKKFIANKFNTTVEMVEIGISIGDENVMSLMRQLTERGINEITGMMA